jgi:hypothetical protein
MNRVTVFFRPIIRSTCGRAGGSRQPASRRHLATPEPTSEASLKAIVPVHIVGISVTPIGFGLMLVVPNLGKR